MQQTDSIAPIAGILQKLPVFAGLYEQEYAHIRAICRPARFASGHTLFREGDGSPCMYVLLDGEISLSSEGLGPLHTVRPGETFGEIGLIAQQKRTATATSLSPVTLLQINGDAFRLLLGREPRISFAIMRNITLGLSQHIVRMNRQGLPDCLPAAEPAPERGPRLRHRR